MRHKRRGRHLGRTSSHRNAMLRNLACSLFLTEREDEFYEGLFQADGRTAVSPPATKGRVVTTLEKAKQVRPLVERCITIARQSLPHAETAEEFSAPAERNSDQWRQWRGSDQWHKWNQAIAPALAARRRVFSILRDKEAVEILFAEIAPRFADRPGGYTRILRLPKPRLGDAGTRAILELVGVRDRVLQKSQRPAFVEETADQPPAEALAEDADDDAAEDAGAQAADEDSQDESSQS